MRWALAAFGITNAILYAALMPLWEGFDEPFHYAYVQELAAGRGFPVQGRTPVSGEVWQSILLAPASEPVQRNIPAVTTFQEYFRLPADRREALQFRLRHLQGGSEVGALNYEAQQAPLAYLLLAPIDWLLRGVALPERIFALRCVCGLVAAGASALLLFSLASRLGMRQSSQEALVFVALASQMFYATACHVANDWLCIPLMILVFDRTVALEASPSSRNAWAAGLALAAGLLTKSYFLALVPLVPGVMIWRRRTRAAAIVAIAGPWYVRNLWLYRDLSGMQQTRGGAHIRSLVAAALHIHWFHATETLLFETLWTGNNSFRTFSAHTLSLLLAGLAAAAVLAVINWARNGIPRGQRVLLAGCLLFAAAIAFDFVAVYSFSGGKALTSSPWYVEAVMPAGLCLLFSGMSRYPRAAQAVSVWLTGLSAYVMLATWWARLVPYYSGFDDRATPLKLQAWYRQGLGGIAGTPGLPFLAGGRFVISLAVAVSAATLALAAVLCARARGATSS